MDQLASWRSLLVDFCAMSFRFWVDVVRDHWLLATILLIVLLVVAMQALKEYLLYRSPP